jgi:hypothetical protein
MKMRSLQIKPSISGISTSSIDISIPLRGIDLQTYLGEFVNELTKVSVPLRGIDLKTLVCRTQISKAS